MRLFSFLYALLALAAFPAHAAPPEVKAAPVQVGDRLGFCALEYPYPDGRQLTFAMSPIYQINLGVTILGGGYEKDKTYEVTYGFDGKPPRKTKARGLNGNTMLIELEVNPPFARNLNQSRSLEIAQAGKIFSFQTDKLQNAVDLLVRCVGENAQKTYPTTNLPDGLQSLLMKAGFKEVQNIPLDGVIPDRKPADFLWRNGTLVGGFVERKAVTESFDALIGTYLAGLKKRCHGLFDATQDPPRKTAFLTWKTAQASCKSQENGPKVVEALLFVLSTDKHFTILMHESEESFANEARTATQRLLRVIESLPPGREPTAIP